MSSRRCAGMASVEVEQMDGVHEDIEFRLPPELRASSGKKVVPAAPIEEQHRGNSSVSGGAYRHLRASSASGPAASAIRSC